MTGSINLSRLMEAVQKQHSSVNQSQKNGQLYANVTVWLDLDAPDQNGNNISITLNSSREGEQFDLQKFEGKKVYVMNGKWPAPKQPAQQWQQNAPGNGWGQQPQQNNGWGGQQQQQPQTGYGQNGQTYQQQPQQWQQPAQPQQGNGFQQPQQVQQPQHGNGFQQPQQANGTLPF